jgi:uncharacterized protein YdhG (YjbR/CyaY superfamily)
MLAYIEWHGGAMISKAKDVAGYLEEVCAERRPAIEKLRRLCRRNLKSFEECMEYGMPCYKQDGALVIAFASQKQYIALYVGRKNVVDEFREALPASSLGKGCIRFNKPEQMDFAVIEQLLRRAVQSKSAPC